MKTALTVLVLLLVSSSFLFAVDPVQPPAYYIVRKARAGVRLSNGKSWDLKPGQAFPFVHWISLSEIQGGEPRPGDQSHVVLQLDDQTLVAPARYLRMAEEKDILDAAGAYGTAVLAYRQAFPLEEAAKAGKKPDL